MTSLVANFNSLNVIGSAAQEIVNWVTTADFAVGKFVQTHQNRRQLVATCEMCTHRRRDSTRQYGVYWA